MVVYSNGNVVSAQIMKKTIAKPVIMIDEFMVENRKVFKKFVASGFPLKYEWYQKYSQKSNAYGFPSILYLRCSHESFLKHPPRCRYEHPFPHSDLNYGGSGRLGSHQRLSEVC